MCFMLTAQDWIPEPYLSWFIALLAVILMLSGYRAIRRRHAFYEVGEAKGRWALALGWFWIILGICFIATVVFDLPTAKKMVTFFIKNKD